jgi:hypothetical protein
MSISIWWISTRFLFTLQKTSGFRFPFVKQHQGFSSTFRRLTGFRFPLSKQHQGFSSPFRRLTDFVSPFPIYLLFSPITSTLLRLYDSDLPWKHSPRVSISRFQAFISSYLHYQVNIVVSSCSRVVSPSPNLHGDEWISVRYFRSEFASLSSWYFISHFTIWIVQQCFFHSLFHMGRVIII